MSPVLPADGERYAWGRSLLSTADVACWGEERKTLTDLGPFVLQLAPHRGYFVAITLRVGALGVGAGGEIGSRPRCSSRGVGSLLQIRHRTSD